MKLILFRHGTALTREEAFLQQMEDSQRPLTEKGKEKTIRMAKSLKSWSENFDLLVSSPFLRARQTADLISKVFEMKRRVECAELVPSAPPEAFCQWMKSQAKTATSVLAVGHEPQLGLFASWALAGFKESFVELKKSGLLCLDFESFEDVGPRSADLIWLMQPKLVPSDLDR